MSLKDLTMNSTIETISTEFWFQRAYFISFKDSACRCFGYIVSKKKYIFTIDDDCFVAKDPSGKEINALQQHITNLLSPSSPFFFNTLYDPYREGADFVCGYPFSLREGVPTAVSHGLWLNIPDYDAPTQPVKPHERNARYVDAVLTIPKGTLIPMCGMNLAFNSELIGPAMYFGLMGIINPLDATTICGLAGAPRLYVTIWDSESRLVYPTYGKAKPANLLLTSKRSTMEFSGKKS